MYLKPKFYHGPIERSYEAFRFQKNLGYFKTMQFKIFFLERAQADTINNPLSNKMVTVFFKDRL